MRARTAPEPVSTGATAVGDYKSRAQLRLSKRQANPLEPGTAESSPPSPAPIQPDVDAAPSASAFAAALISSTGQPTVTEQREKALKLSRAALPAQGSLALTDRRV
jgi:hypothetical protein